MTERRRRADGEATKLHVLETALALFRKHGFDTTTMRDVASAAGLSLGAAYYYFPSKEALVLAYYERTQEQHEARLVETFAKTPDLRERLGAVVHTKLDMLRKDRKLLVALFRSAGDPESPYSVFGDATGRVRTQAIGMFVKALEREALPSDARALAANALWLLHLATLLYFIRDTSPRQERTRALVDGTLDLLCPLIPLAGSPMLGPVRARIAKLLGDAGLFGG